MTESNCGCGLPAPTAGLSTGRVKTDAAGRPYLLELLDHFLNEDVSVLGNFALHLRQPFAELLVLLTEDRPFIQPLADLLPP